MTTMPEIVANVGPVDVPPASTGPMTERVGVRK
ncbi:hypothetical protein SAMN05216174_11557 [Actinokineospora iranica]|uniref:Uncharacterized protein n=1 Tax=Actinokineospora iranica TaxID=1271860 RepID=A0A1G6WL22_9PSEU|nr:hypothetical protein SAMN05216174_11557 [Actinokineospora iranica]